MQIPVIDLKSEINEYWQEFNDAFQRVLKSSQFIGGTEVQAFEKEVSEYLGVKHAIGVNSGTDALVISLRASGVKQGDEVIVPSFTFFATAEAVSVIGATPVFIDIEPHTFNIDTKLIEEKITNRTRAIVPVHLFGHPANMEEILGISSKYGLKVIEDTAQAFGADINGKKVGTFGTAGAFSFFPSKNLGGFGDGGLIVTNDDAIAETARKLSMHGSIKKYHNEMIGYNSRLDAIQAAMLRIKLKNIDKTNELRIKAARRYHELLADVSGIVVPFEPVYGTHVFHQYTIRVKGGRRNEIYEKLLAKGIQTMIYYPVPIHRMKPYNLPLNLVETDRACEEVLSLPIWPKISLEIQKMVIDNINESLRVKVRQKTLSAQKELHL